MDINYVYIKKRGEFGKQCMFGDQGPVVLDNYQNKNLYDNYILKDPVDRATQCGYVQAEHEANTVRASYDSRGMNHTEGGWPKDINVADIEQTVRFRRKIEKDEMYLHTVLQLAHNMEHCILQNNAVDIYEQYYYDVEPTPFVERSNARTINVFRDPSPTPNRPVTHLSWAPDGTRIAVSHCNLGFQKLPGDYCTHSYIWEIENPNRPELILKPFCPLSCVEYNPRDPHLLISGMYSGQVSCWDTRRGHSPVEVSLMENSHRDPVTGVLWINSKSGSEFFSGSSDGQCKWWDTRKLSEPTETLMIDPVKQEEQKMSRCLGVSCLEYEVTIPTRFMIGTEQGIVVSCNRKGKTPAEKLASKFSAHFGPVYALQRNPSFVKNFLTIGDWTVRIWSEDCKESSIIWTSFHKARLTHGSWSPTRFSVFYTTRTDGVLDVWDILQKQREASLSIKVSDAALTYLRPHEQGQFLACGNSEGSTYLIELGENLIFAHKNDKPQLTAMFERESRREKILEARIREIRLKLKQPPRLSVPKDLPPTANKDGTKDVSKPDYVLDAAVEAAEKEYFKMIENEINPDEAEPEVPDTQEETEDLKSENPEPETQQLLVLETEYSENKLKIKEKNKHEVLDSESEAESKKKSQKKNKHGVADSESEAEGKKKSKNKNKQGVADSESEAESKKKSKKKNKQGVADFESEAESKKEKKKHPKKH